MNRGEDKRCLNEVLIMFLNTSYYLHLYEVYLLTVEVESHRLSQLLVLHFLPPLLYVHFLRPYFPGFSALLFPLIRWIDRWMYVGRMYSKRTPGYISEPMDRWTALPLFCESVVSEGSEIWNISGPTRGSSAP